jgi:antitoxin MazE
MRTLIKKWGNSAAVRIPASVMSDAALQIDQCVEVREERPNRYRALPAPFYDLDSLIDELDPSELEQVS